MARLGVWSICAFGAAILAFAGCAAKAPRKGSGPMAAYTDTPMPTVPPASPTPPPTEAPLPTRPVGNAVTPRKGEVIGPVVTFFGAAKADGTKVDPVSVDKDGTETYQSSWGSGFMLVVEAKPGKSGFGVGRSVFAYVSSDPKTRPDLQIESSRDMGNGSVEVCDRRRPNIGGIPGIRRPDFSETQHISDAINDFACRFETFIESESSCTLTPTGDYSFVKKESTTQFCMIVARAYAFPEGETLLSVRLRDEQGNPGPVKHMRIVRPPAPSQKTPSQKTPSQKTPSQKK